MPCTNDRRTRRLPIQAEHVGGTRALARGA